MNLDRKIVNYMLIGFVFILFLFIIGAYFMKVSPLQDDVKQARATLEMEEQLLAILEQQNQVVEEEQIEFSTYLKRIPGDLFLEHWLVQMEGIESSSDTNITSYSFSAGSYQLTFPTENEETEGEAEGVEDDVPSMENNVPAEVNESINQVTASLTVTADSFEKLHSFLEEVEELERMTQVNAVSFSEPTDDEGVESFTMNASVSIFYLPDLLDDITEYDIDNSIFQRPSGKTNPF
ncbi:MULTISPECIES: hypothetical protein [Bacillaceae]|uniref:Uncharacterized protein n=1 Tax=Evansella alkalicola TaxID=745819 RepID=A0ABS6JTL6_9BACI|nr:MULTISPECIES: hypothetical protein [Bacillaceae]MBU9721909.1 hypothetical protein [Bacillus alkalicola]